MWSAICFNLDPSKILSSGNGLNLGYKDAYLPDVLKQRFISKATEYSSV